jgi:hypothetical protein
MIKDHGLWILYFTFVPIAIFSHQGESLFLSNGPLPWGKPILWAVLLAFLGYSLYCHVQENFFKTMSITAKYHWTKQIGIDLYLGVAIVACIIYLNEGSWLVLALWFIPLLIFANLATLLYLALNYDALISHFT